MCRFFVSFFRRSLRFDWPRFSRWRMIETALCAAGRSKDCLVSLCQLFVLRHARSEVNRLKNIGMLRSECLLSIAHSKPAIKSKISRRCRANEQQRPDASPDHDGMIDAFNIAASVNPVRTDPAMPARDCSHFLVAGERPTNNIVHPVGFTHEVRGRKRSFRKL